MDNIKPYKYFRIFYRIPVIAGVFGFIIAIFLSQLVTFKEYQILKNKEEDDVISYSSLLEDKIKAVLNSAYSAAYILGLLHDRVDFENQFDKIGKDILEKLPLIDAVQWNEEGIIKHVYPLEGNEASLGFDIFNDTITHKYIEAYEAIEKDELFFAGPFELKQGGWGIVGRLPIQKDGRFFAFSTIIIKLEKFFELLDYNLESSSKYYVQFSKLNPSSNEVEFFLPEESGFDGYLYTKKINEGNWTLTVQLRRSEAFKRILIPLILRSFFSIIFGLAIFSLAKLPSLLQNEVYRKSKALRKTIRRFNMASKATSDAIWELDFSKNKTFRSKNFVELFGYSSEFFKMNQEGFESLIHPEDKDLAVKNFREFLNGKEKIWKQEFRFLRENGDYAHVLDKGILLRNKDGSPRKLIGAIQDITLLKQREESLVKLNEKLNQRAKDLQLAFNQLEDSEKRYRDLFELSPLPMWVYDLETLRFLDVNNAAIEKYGYSRKEFLSKTIYEIRPFEEVHILEEELGKRKNNNGLIFSGMFLHSKKNGELIDVEISSNKIQFKGSTTVLVLAVDVTLRNKYIGAIEIQNTKLKEIAWIQSHVVRAPLARLLGLINLLESEKNDDPDKSISSFEDLFGHIRISASELDEIIKTITEKTERINLE